MLTRIRDERLIPYTGIPIIRRRNPTQKSGNPRMDLSKKRPRSLNDAPILLPDAVPASYFN